MRRPDIVEAVWQAVAGELPEPKEKSHPLGLSEVAIDGSLHKAPCGGEGTGSSPFDL